MKRRIFHIVDRFEDTNSEALKRKKSAWESWDTLYESGQLIPAHCWTNQYPRNSKQTLGDKRPLPYLKDLIEHGMNQADDLDILLFSNDDNCIHPMLPEYLLFHIGTYGACSIFRTSFSRPPLLNVPAEQFSKSSDRKHIGRDGFAFTKAWLHEFWDEIPDAVLCAPEWDLQLSMLIRLCYNIKTTNLNLGDTIFPAETMFSYLGHIHHPSTWNMPDTVASPSNVWNRKLLKDFVAKNLPDLKLNPDGAIAGQMT